MCNKVLDLESFVFKDPAHPERYTLSLHDALPIFHQPGLDTGPERGRRAWHCALHRRPAPRLRHRRQSTEDERSEEHTSELQSRVDLVCRILLEKKTGRWKERLKIPCA